MDLTPGPEVINAARNAFVADLMGDDPLMEAVTVAYRAGREEAARCSSCDHLLNDHSEGGCWYTVTAGRGNLVCVCVVERR